ncbi:MULTISPECIES: rhodanese-like domain-containing protein [Lelliottia]|jgi:rhodanese-related sulfurtransferase|uniref:rhodanese-like domain-containing protein n=1 Tax=Lelliottia TaxID=1330545 RepID=UPI00249E83D3|nr:MULTISPECIES: rhodanese-like domain-containing protein [unclassified Lelliottia]MDI3360471.1 rhodanese-like domain-containing protein [Lelliottia sp. V89_13]MDK9357675.1 rhodanese-like domain-containing protein [Lelliottia sp. V106_16]MDK9372833.1 rhodanese-like domain-containing protein [Lelliottia sp. V106_10]MDK9551109.1 rhodanese-like domain-containing protein [Lelliottia sp. V89_5]MDK9582922.1 rhodanese-like domain-containing protein [Lelliottia sp. V86_10]
MSYVTEFPAADPQESVAHFLRRLSVETDCADVHHALANHQQDFVLLHVVGRPEQFARRHLPGAVHLPWSAMTAETMAQWPQDTLFVVYCAGPHCNGADRAALKLSRLGLPVKIMIGGITGWEDENFAFASED